jgi:hypothetical protein
MAYVRVILENQVWQTRVICSNLFTIVILWSRDPKPPKIYLFSLAIPHGRISMTRLIILLCPHVRVNMMRQLLALFGILLR